MKYYRNWSRMLINTYINNMQDKIIGKILNHSSLLSLSLYQNCLISQYVDDKAVLSLALILANSQYIHDHNNEQRTMLSNSLAFHFFFLMTMCSFKVTSIQLNHFQVHRFTLKNHFHMK